MKLENLHFGDRFKTSKGKMVVFFKNYWDEDGNPDPNHLVFYTNGEGGMMTIICDINGHCSDEHERCEIFGDIISRWEP